MTFSFGHLLWCFGKGLRQRFFIAGDRNPSKLVQITKSKCKLKKPAGYLTCTPVEGETPFMQLGLEASQIRVVFFPFSVALWLIFLLYIPQTLMPQNWPS